MLNTKRNRKILTRQSTKNKSSINHDKETLLQ